MITLEHNKIYYFLDSYDYLYQGRFIEIPANTQTDDTLVTFRDAYFVDNNDNKIGFAGHLTTRRKFVFESLDDLLRFVQNNHEKEVEAYKAEINTIEDLIAFALKYPLCGEDPDYAAKEAYIAKATELTNKQGER
ncbi:MAG: hypothetical protein K6C13_06005 [Oscillospiraceae bacterium]|nr:hypothetical protein [Oscillospiraceae bacterium]